MRALSLALPVLACLLAVPPPSPVVGKGVPPNPRKEAKTLSAKATAMKKAGRHAEAAALFQEAYQKHSDPSYIFQAAVECEAASDLACALRCYRTAETVARDHAHAEEARVGASLVEELMKVPVAVDVLPEGADLFLDGKWVGKSPLPDLSLSPGRHLVTVHKDGFKDERIELDIVLGSPPVKHATRLQALPGRLAITANVAAGFVYVDGKAAGSLPLAQPIEVAPGEHVVAVEAAGYRGASLKVRVAGNEIAMPRLTLEAIPAPAPPPPVVVPPAPEGERHEGFYFRLGLGPGYLAAMFDANEDTSRTIHGISGMADLAIGGFPVENLALSVQAFGVFTFRPTVCYKGKCKDSGSVQGGAYGFGGGITYHFMPANVFLNLAAGAGGYRSSGTNADVTGDLGFAARLGLGKEWWVSEHWGLGLGLDGQYVRPRDHKTNDPWNVVAAGLLLTVTCN